jgi:hypothetical protein
MVDLNAAGVQPVWTECVLRTYEMQTKQERLKQLREQFDELTESLALSGKKRAGTTWQTDRLKAREEIRREMEDLESIPPVPRYRPAPGPIALPRMRETPMRGTARARTKVRVAQAASIAYSIGIPRHRGRDPHTHV